MAKKARPATLRLKVIKDLDSIAHLIEYAAASTITRNIIARPHVFQGLSVGLRLMFWTEGALWSLMIKTLSLSYGIKVASCINRFESVAAGNLPAVRV